MGCTHKGQCWQGDSIVLDNVVYSAPRVTNEIDGGSSVISGNFTIEETKDLANTLKSGRMPHPHASFKKK